MKPIERLALAQRGVSNFTVQLVFGHQLTLAADCGENSKVYRVPGRTADLILRTFVTFDAGEKTSL